jgi:DNA-binding protein YbaB
MTTNIFTQNFREDNKFIDGYSFRHIIEMLVHNEKVVDRDSAMKCFNELTTWAMEDAYHSVTESMSDILKAARKGKDL